MDFLQENLIKENIKYPYDVKILNTVNSTNTYAKENYDNFKNNFIVVSEAQTGGRGRNGKSFSSPKGDGIYMSVLHKGEYKIQDILKYTCIMSVAIYKSLYDLYGVKTQIKWVNDIEYNGRKLAGILCESGINLKTGFCEYMVIGVGINVFNKFFEGDLAEKAISLGMISSGKISRNDIIIEIVNNFNNMLKSDLWYDIYCDNSAVLGKEINVYQNNTIFTAKAEKIDKNGNLIIKKDNEEILLSSAQISIRY